MVSLLLSGEVQGTFPTIPITKENCYLSMFSRPSSEENTHINNIQIFGKIRLN